MCLIYKKELKIMSFQFCLKDFSKLKLISANFVMDAIGEDKYLFLLPF